MIRRLGSGSASTGPRARRRAALFFAAADVALTGVHGRLAGEARAGRQPVPRELIETDPPGDGAAVRFHCIMVSRPSHPPPGLDPSQIRADHAR